MNAMCIKSFDGPDFNPSPDSVSEPHPQVAQEYTVEETITCAGTHYYYLTGFENAYNADHFAVLGKNINNLTVVKKEELCEA